MYFQRGVVLSCPTTGVTVAAVLIGDVNVVCPHIDGPRAQGRVGVVALSAVVEQLAVAGEREVSPHQAGAGQVDHS